MGLAIHLLGCPHVERDGQVLPAPRGHKAWGLLAYLAHSKAPASRSHLAALLFEDAHDPLGALRWNLSELRRLLGESTLHGNPLELGRDMTLDTAFVTSGTWRDALAVPGLGCELLEGMSFPASPSFEVWLATGRRHQQAAAEAVLREAALAHLALGKTGDAVHLAARLVRLNPLDENFQALLVRSLAAAGDGVGAARQVASCREIFQRELGIQPGPALSAAMNTVTSASTLRPASGRAAVLAQLEAGDAAINAGALEAGLHCLRRSVMEADITGDAVLRARTRLALGGALVHAARGCDEEGATALHEALAVGQLASPLLAAAASRELGYVEFLRGSYNRAQVWLDQAAALARDDPLEASRIATLYGSTLSDTAHYAAAISMLSNAVVLAEQADDAKQTAYALSMLGRTHLLCNDLDAAAAALDRSIRLARQGWTAFLPWPQALRAEVDLLQGNVDDAAHQLEQAFALGCQLGDPCWQGIAGRGLGLVAKARGEGPLAIHTLLDSIERCGRLPDSYLWGKAYALDALCSLAVHEKLPEAQTWTAELQRLAARSGMRELTARAHLHRANLGDAPSGQAARQLAAEIANPALSALCNLR